MAQPEKQNRFSNSKVYKIECNVTGIIYVGSTTKELNVRLNQHKACYKAYLAGKFNYLTSFKVLENNDYDIHLLRAYDLKDNIDLIAREGYYIKKLNCVNKNIPGRTDAEYYLDNKIELNIKHNLYYNQNRIKIAAQNKTVCVCVCGKTYTHNHKSRHLESKKHIKLMAVIVPQIV